MIRIDSPVWEAIGWALLHSLWQFTLLALLGWVLLRLSPKKGSASLRYNWLMGLLTCTVLLFGLTLWWILPNVQAPTAAADNTVWEAASASPPVATPKEAGPTPSWLVWLSSYFPCIVSSWLAGIVLLSLRQGVQYLSLRRYRSRGVRTAPLPIQTKWAELQQRMQIKRSVALLESSLVKGLSTFGHLKPIVLAPVGLLSQLTAAEAEALLLHELAHIRRNDYLHNLLLGSIEILFFYHPGVWWLSHKLKQERENCCDELVCQSGVSPLIYADALLAAARYSSNFKPTLVMNANAHAHLSDRITRLLIPNADKTPRLTSPFVGLALTLLLVLTLSLQPLFAQRNVNINMDQLRTLYVGVPNEVNIKVSDVPADELAVKSDDPIEIRATGNGDYTIIPVEEGTIRLQLSGGGMEANTVEMEAVTLPDPVASLAGVVGGPISLELFKEQTGLQLLPAHLNNYCKITSYTIAVFDPESKTAIEAIMQEVDFSTSAKRLVDRTVPNDIIYIDDVHCQCKHQDEPVPINSLVFKLR